MAGDLNVHTDNRSNSLATTFSNITNSFNLVQHVCSSTHVHGHTLDLVFSFSLPLNSLSMFDFASEHKCIIFDTMLQSSAQPQKHTIHSRFLNAHSAATLSSWFSDSYTPPSNSSNVNDLVTWFNNHCASALDIMAPYTTRSLSSDNSRPWFNDNIRLLKREARRVEHSWKKYKLMVHLLRLKELLSILKQNIKEARFTYFSELNYQQQTQP